MGNDLSQPVDLEEDLAEKGGLEDSPFTFLFLSSHDSTQAMRVKEQEGEEDNDNDELMKQAVPSTQPQQEEGEEERKQATTHISVPPDVVLLYRQGKESQNKFQVLQRKVQQYISVKKAWGPFKL